MSNIQLRTEADLKLFLHKNYMSQINNFFGDEKRAMKFLSSVMSAVQQTPKLLECDGKTLVNSFMTMAQLGLMPSGVSGEAYVLPYRNKGQMEAQFQLGYQGLITLFYRAGGQKIRAEIVREHDEFTYKNGEISHSIDILKSREERGKAMAAYAIATVNGTEISLAMNAADILSFGKKFSKSFGSKFTPWNEENDPALWMWKKTVLKQLGKLLPKNETIHKALAEDNKDSVVSDRIEKAKQQSDSLKMGSLAALETKKPLETASDKTPPTPAAKEGVIEGDTAPPPPAPPEEVSDRKKKMMEGMEKAKQGEDLPEQTKTCSNCAGNISDPEYTYSMKFHNKPLCRECQPK